MSYTVTAKRWAHGWELHIADVGVTQARTLADATRMVCDYVESLTGRSIAADEVEIRPELDGLEAKAAEVRERNEHVQQETRDVAAASRAIARELRKAGLSLSDTAAVLGISRGRVSQLVKP